MKLELGGIDTATTPKGAVMANGHIARYASECKHSRLLLGEPYCPHHTIPIRTCRTYRSGCFIFIKCFVVYWQTHVFVPFYPISNEKMNGMLFNCDVEHLFCSASAIYGYLTFAKKMPPLIVWIIGDIM